MFAVIAQHNVWNVSHHLVRYVCIAQILNVFDLGRLVVENHYICKNKHICIYVYKMLRLCSV